MNLLAMRSMLRRRIGNISTTDAPDATLTEHINSAVEEIRDKYKFRVAEPRARFSTVAGTARYLLTTLTDTVLKVWDRTNGKELAYVGVNYVAANDNINVTNGRPQKYGRFEDYLELFPPPDGVYEIELKYKERHTALAADGDIPDLPLAWHRGVVIYASFLYFDTDGLDLAKAKYHLSAWNAWVANKPVEAHEENAAADTGVELPTMGPAADKRLTWDESP